MPKTGFQSEVLSQGPRVLLLTTEVFGAEGGIPAYMRRLLQVFTDYSSFGGGCMCVSLAGKAVHSEIPPPGFASCGFRAYGSKLSFAAGALRTAWQFQPDITIAGHLGLAPVAMAIRATCATKSYGIVLHGIEAWKRAEWKDRLAARFADVVVATTNYTATTFQRFNDVRPDAMRVVPLALGETELPEPEKANDRSSIRLLTVGRLAACEQYKGVDILIQAVGMLIARGHRVELTVVGKGDDLARLKSLTESLWLNQVVRFLGGVSDAELQRQYARCDIFAMPSKGEGFGIVFLEAMRHGKPCIGGNHGGTPDVIDHAVNGLLVEHGDVVGLARSIEFLIESEERRAAMGREAQLRVRREYLFDSFCANWRRLLHSVMEGPEALSAPTTARQRQ